MQIQEKSDLLDALVNLNDKSPLEYEPLDTTEYVRPVMYESLELLEYLSEIKIGLEIIKNGAKGRVDKKITEQFDRINNAVTVMTEKLSESRPPN
ncbi:MAG TPA: hypothetical protein VLD38_07890 [Nitrosopumilaceae archaeon]|nr:hypothetical protein [Nitrosopumilaceae archaeon]